MTEMTRLDYYKADVFVEIIDFGDVKGSEMVTPNSDGSYTIFVNARKSFEAQQEALQHALLHISKDDFEKDDVQQIEAEAHNISVEKIIIEQREEATKQLVEEPKFVKHEIEVREKLIKAIAEEGRKQIEYERHASFRQYMWNYHQEEYLRMREEQWLNERIM